MTTATAPKFSLGRIVMTQGAEDALDACLHPKSTALALLLRHRSGDWGELDQHDQRVNNAAVKNGSRILSAYTLPTGTTLWIITEADRRTTTLLLPDEY